MCVGTTKTFIFLFKVRTVLNPSPVPATAEGRELLLKLFPLIGFLVLNEHESEALCGVAVSDVASAFAACKALIELGCTCVVLTLGGQGAVVSHKNKTHFHVPSPVVKVVDTTGPKSFVASLLFVELWIGAGDSFLGAFVHFLSSSDSLEEAHLKRAATCACIVASVSVQKQVKEKRTALNF
jgi:ribokinase